MSKAIAKILNSESNALVSLDGCDVVSLPTPMYVSSFVAIWVFVVIVCHLPDLRHHGAAMCDIDVMRR